jgi:chaperonin GroES
VSETPAIARALEALDERREAPDLSTKDWAIEPMPGRVAVLLRDGDEMIGSIIIPASRGPERTIWGTVLQVCATYEQDGEEYEPLFKIGDLVVFGKYSGTELLVGRSKVLIIREKDVLARLHNIKQEDLTLGRVSISERD